jgi:hypothetical protein
MTRFTTNVIEVEHGKGYWSTLIVEILDAGKKIGEYTRDYHKLYGTFYPFKQGDQWYALYSKNYTCTRVMELPSCKDIGGEEPCGNGFCPTGYYIPYADKKILGQDYGDEPIVGPNGQFGFICGCVWGDDTSWKIQFLDLSQVSKGLLKRDDRFGYLEMIDGYTTLKDCIGVGEFTEKEYNEGTVWITITSSKDYQLSGESES